MSNTSYLVTQDATGTAYDNSTSGLTATDVQAAIDEVAGASGGSGDYVVLNVADLGASPSASVTWNSTYINSTYKSYEIYAIGIKNSNGTSYPTLARITETGTPVSGGTSYKQASSYSTSAPAGGDLGGDVDTGYLYVNTIDSTKGMNFKLELTDSQSSTSETEMKVDIRYRNTSSQQEKLVASISRDAAATSDGIEIYTTAGTFNAGYMVLVGKN